MAKVIRPKKASTEIRVDPRVMQAAKAARREGKRLVIVSETEVHVVNKAP